MWALSLEEAHLLWSPSIDWAWPAVYSVKHWMENGTVWERASGTATLTRRRPRAPAWRRALLQPTTLAPSHTHSPHTPNTRWCISIFNSTEEYIQPDSQNLFHTSCQPRVCLSVTSLDICVSTASFEDFRIKKNQIESNNHSLSNSSRSSTTTIINNSESIIKNNSFMKTRTVSMSVSNSNFQQFF